MLRRYKEKEDLLSPEVMRDTERIIMLNVIDQQWKDHLLSMDHLREGIGLRGYGQKDPLIEYKKESFKLYEAMRDRVEDETVRYLYFLQAVEQVPDLPDEPDFNAIDPSLGLSPDANLGLPAYGDEHWGNGNSNGSSKPPAAAPPPDFSAEQRQAAQHSVEEFTKKIERKKQKELDAIQFVGPTAANPTQQNFNKYKDVGRNDPCPCGSGKKYKKCHGA